MFIKAVLDAGPDPQSKVVRMWLGRVTFKKYATDTRNMSLVTNRYTVEELRSIVAPVAERYGVDKVYLFGSVARGDHNEDSDYDFCIELGKIRSLLDLSEFFQDLREAVGRDIDLVDTESVGSEFLNKILTEGVRVYGG